MATTNNNAAKQQQQEIQAIHKKLKKDISDIQTKADLLSGNAEISTINVKGKKVSAIKQSQSVGNKNLPKFLKFMEENYKNSNINVELKKRI